MTIKQTLRRIQQQKPFGDLFETQTIQIELVKKLYKKQGLEISGGGACPEKYNVLKDGKEIAYYRLRHGEFSIDKGNKTISLQYPNGDGMFDKDERVAFLLSALNKITE